MAIPASLKVVADFQSLLVACVGIAEDFKGKSSVAEWFAAVSQVGVILGEVAQIVVDIPASIPELKGMQEADIAAMGAACVGIVEAMIQAIDAK